MLMTIDDALRYADTLPDHDAWDSRQAAPILAAHCRQLRECLRNLRGATAGKVTTIKLAEWMKIHPSQLCAWAPLAVPNTPPDFIERG